MKLTRRRALKQATQLTAAALLGGTAPGAAKTPASQRIRLGGSTYSYSHFRKERYPVERVIEDAARLGFDGVEILHRQMAEESPAYMNKLKRLAFANGLDLIMLSIHQDFVSPDAAERRKAIEAADKAAKEKADAEAATKKEREFLEAKAAQEKRDAEFAKKYNLPVK